jgi:DNA invertase Pin-like site-specific DNA recombinase
MSKRMRAALYLRVSTDGQTTDNQSRTLTEVAERRGWTVTATYQDAGISGAKGRDKRPGFDAMLRGATRRRFDVLMFWSIDRLGRSTAAVTTALAELDAAGVAIYADKEAMDATTPHGRAMLQMAAVFAELERVMIRERVMAGLARVRAEGKKKLGRPKVGRKVEDAIRVRLSAGDGMLKVSRALGVGVSTVMRVRKAMYQTPVVASWQTTVMRLDRRGLEYGEVQTKAFRQPMRMPGIRLIVDATSMLAQISLSWRTPHRCGRSQMPTSVPQIPIPQKRLPKENTPPDLIATSFRGSWLPLYRPAERACDQDI